MIFPRLVSPLEPIKNEWSILSDLFESGLQKYYLRKTGLSLQDYEKCLKNIPERFLNRIVLHEHFTIMFDYPFKEIHLKTREREAFAVKERFHRLINEAHNIGIKCSTSVHSIDELWELNGIMDRIWVGPIFNSISKPGLKPTVDWIKELNNETLESKLVALGGIHVLNAPALMRKPFNEIIISGGLWKQNDPPVQVFRNIEAICKDYVLSY